MNIGSLESWKYKNPLTRFYISVFGSPVLNVQYNWYLLRKYLSPLFLEKSSTKSLQLLDIGCGDGKFANLITYTHNIVCDGVDRLPELINIASKTAQLNNFNNHFYETTVEQLSSKEKYDFIVCMDVLEHVDNPKNFIATIASLLNKGGKVFIRTPHLDDTKIFFKEKQDFAYGPDVHVTKGFSLNDVQNLTDSSNLKLIQFEYNYHWLGQLLWEFTELLWKIQPLYYISAPFIFKLLLLIEKFYSAKDSKANGIFFVLALE